ncbi:MAG: hypothetical protein ABIY55_13115 [Kofleriaceae bacterium]
MRLPALFTVVAFAASCSSRHEPRAADPPAGAGLAIVHDAAAAPPDASTVQQHMREHFAAASELERAIARGHLDEARDRARWLLEHDEPMLDGWQPFVAELRAAARDLIAAPDLPTAAALAARVGRACSRCHDAKHAVVSFAWEPVLDEAPALQVQMKRHQWSAARLWEGLVGPSDEMWNEGTSLLAVAKLDVLLATSGTPRGDTAALADKVRRLSQRAGKVTDHDERATLYGDLLSTCAGCHQLVRPTPVPGP